MPFCFVFGLAEPRFFAVTSRVGSERSTGVSRRGWCGLVSVWSLIDMCDVFNYDVMVRFCLAFVSLLY